MSLLFFQQLFWYKQPSDQAILYHRISVTFVDKDGSEKTISVPVGLSMLEAAHENDIELEGISSCLEIDKLMVSFKPCCVSYVCIFLCLVHACLCSRC
jgi:hypothetical protein